MRKSFFVSVALTALFAVSAMAADLPIKAPVAVAPVFSWSGCYAGLNAGYSWRRLDNSLVINQSAPPVGYFNPAAVAGVNATGSGGLDANGFTGGAQVGCNWQSGTTVWGVETDINYLDHTSGFGGRFPYTTNPLVSYDLNVSASGNWFYTLRGRLGYAADRTLWFVTGGLAATELRFNQNFTEPGSAVQSASSSRAEFGWTVGAGVERAWVDKWTVKLEYLFARFSPGTISGSLVPVGGAVGTSTFNNSLNNLDLHIVRIGTNYKF